VCVCVCVCVCVHPRAHVCMCVCECVCVCVSKRPSITPRKKAIRRVIARKETHKALCSSSIFHGTKSHAKRCGTHMSYTYTHARTHTYTHTRTHTYTQAHSKHTHARTHSMHTLARTHAHTHTHAHTRLTLVGPRTLAQNCLPPVLGSPPSL